MLKLASETEENTKKPKQGALQIGGPGEYLVLFRSPKPVISDR